MFSEILGPMLGVGANVATGGLASGIGTGVAGLAQGIPALINTIKLNRTPRPEFQTLQGVQDAAQRAEQRAQFGFSPTQTANFQSNLGNVIQSDFRNARDMSGGGLAQAINSKNMGQRLRSTNQFAADDSNQMQRNIQYSDSMQKFLQGENNRQQQQQMDYRMQDERATGQTLASGISNVGSYFNQNAALGNFGKGGFGGAKGGGASGSFFPSGTNAPQGGFGNFGLLQESNAPTIFGQPFGG